MRLTKWKVKQEYNGQGVGIVTARGQLPLDETILTDALVDGLGDKAKAKYFDAVPAAKPTASKTDAKDGDK